jgi:hypothetical protein
MYINIGDLIACSSLKGYYHILLIIYMKLSYGQMQHLSGTFYNFLEAFIKPYNPTEPTNIK